MQKTRCMTYFEIVGNFNIAEITKILKLKNTSGHEIGDKKIYGENQYDCASWKYGTEYEETLDAEEQIKKVVTPFLSKIEELNYIRTHYDCVFCLEQVQEIYNEEKPGIFYNVDVIKFCAQIEAAIDVDIYIY